MIFPIYFCSREVFPPVWCRYWWGGGGLSQWPSTRRQPSLGWSAATFSVSDFTRKQFSTRYVLYCSYWTLNVDLTYTVQYPYQNALEHGTYNGRNVSVCKVVFIHDGVMYILWWVTRASWPVLSGLSDANGCNGHCSDTRLSAYCEPRLCKC